MIGGDSNYYETLTEYDEKWEFKFVYNKLTQIVLMGSLLDIGCGDGRFINLVGDRLKATGIDFNLKAIQSARMKRGINVYQATFEEFIERFPERRYDVVTMFHILEHMESPDELIGNVKKTLNPNGLVFISVPNPNRWTLHWVREVWDYPPHHLTRWSSHNLRVLLESYGFEMIEECTERMETLSQARNAFRDIVWAVVFRRFSFGIASRLDAGRERIAVLNGNTLAGYARTLLRLLLSGLVSVKGRAVQLLSYVLALMTYPLFLLGNYGGRSLLIIARLRNEGCDGR